MPEVQKIIKEFKQKFPQELPPVSNPRESDVKILEEELRNRPDPANSALLKALLTETKFQLKHPDFVKPILDVNFGQIQDKPFLTDIKIRVCEAVIASEEFHKINVLDMHFNDLLKIPLNTNSSKSRFQIVQAGRLYLMGDYLHAATQYLAASREEAFLKDQPKKQELVTKAIGFAYIAARSSQRHRVICTLCLNEIAKKSSFRQILDKLYTEDMINSEESAKIEAILPKYLREKDIDGVSLINQAKFSHNMIPIMNSFSSISFKTLERLIGLKMNQIFILIEKTFHNGEVMIDQISEYVYFVKKEGLGAAVKDLLTKIDEILE